MSNNQELEEKSAYELWCSASSADIYKSNILETRLSIKRIMRGVE